MRKSLLLLALLLFLEAAYGQPFRTLPAAGELGRTGEPRPLPDVKIGRKVLRLGPGALVFDQNNRTILHGLIPAHAHVFFTRDGQGDIRRLYILTDEERARLLANPPRKIAPGAPTLQP